MLPVCSSTATGQRASVPAEIGVAVTSSTNAAGNARFGCKTEIIPVRANDHAISASHSRVADCSKRIEHWLQIELPNWQMTLSTSAVAVCCSRACCNSRLSRALFRRLAGDADFRGGFEAAACLFRSRPVDRGADRRVRDAPRVVFAFRRLLMRR